jgi:hypothetical protein
MQNAIKKIAKFVISKYPEFTDIEVTRDYDSRAYYIDKERNYIYNIFVTIDKSDFTQYKEDDYIKWEKLKSDIREVIKMAGIDNPVYVFPNLINEEISKIKSTINESEIPSFIRRRISSIDFQSEIDNVMHYEININDYFNSSAFVANVCDLTKDNILEGMDASPKDKDSLYFFLVDKFGTHIYSYFYMRKKRKR